MQFRQKTAIVNSQRKKHIWRDWLNDIVTSSQGHPRGNGGSHSEGANTTVRSCRYGLPWQEKEVRCGGDDANLASPSVRTALTIVRQHCWKK